MYTKFGVYSVTLLWAVCINSQLNVKNNPHSNKNSRLPVGRSWWLWIRKLSVLIRKIFVPSLVSVAKTNPPTFDKRWRYRVPLPRPLMNFCQCLAVTNTDMCSEFHEILSMLSASKSEYIIQKNIPVWYVAMATLY